MNRKINKNKSEKRKVEKRKAERKFIPNTTTTISEVSSNWFSFINSENIMLKKVKDPRRDRNFENFKISETSIEHKITKVLSLDCEMVSDMDNRDMLGRVSVVNYELYCIYDKFVKPSSMVGDYRTRYSGLRESDLERGVDFDIVQREVEALLRNKILVGHALGNDFKVLKFGHDRRLIRDTSKYDRFREINGGKSPSLKNLAKSFLGENIQEGEHSSVEDAKTAMKLYIKYRHEWEASLGKPQGKRQILFV